MEEFQAAWQTEMYTALNFAQFPANRPLWRLFLQCTYVRTYSTTIQKLAMTIMTLLYALYAKNVGQLHTILYGIAPDGLGYARISLTHEERGRHASPSHHTS